VPADWLSHVVIGVHRVMQNQLSKIQKFVTSAVVMFDQYADLYVTEVKVQNSEQQVIATKIDMKQFIGVRTPCRFTLF